MRIEAQHRHAGPADGEIALQARIHKLQLTEYQLRGNELCHPPQRYMPGYHPKAQILSHHKHERILNPSAFGQVLRMAWEIEPTALHGVLVHRERHKAIEHLVAQVEKEPL